ncbi:MAG: mannose-6-phosphate isomerase, partial [Planctomycetaceae bacterium]
MSDVVQLPPLVFAPLLKRIRWGGRRLGTVLGKSIGAEANYAEGWEITNQRDSESRIDTGP